jgi:hypothetical protein
MDRAGRSIAYVSVLARRFLGACLMAGMIAGGAFTLSTFPRAGLTYMWTMTLASALALFLCDSRSYLITAGFLLLFAVFMSRNVAAHGNLFSDNLKAQLQLERQTEIISLLLKEFQENASDRLWQTDAEGHLIQVPARFSEVTQMSLPRASNWSPSPAEQQRLDREAGAAAAGGGGVGIVHAERGADQVVDEIDLGARQKRHRGRVHQYHRAVALDHQVVLGLGMLDIELVLKAGTAAAFHRNAQHGAIALGFEDFANPPGGPLADADGCGHDGCAPARVIPISFGIPRQT